MCMHNPEVGEKSHKWILLVYDFIALTLILGTYVLSYVTFY